MSSSTARQQRIRRFKKHTNLSLLSCVAATVLLSACSSNAGGAKDTEGGDAISNYLIPADTVNKLGYITFISVDAAGFAEGGLANGLLSHGVSFKIYDQLLGRDQLDSSETTSRSNVAVDTCEIIFDDEDDSQNGEGSDVETSDSEQSNYRIVSAGQALSILSPAGSWSELLLTEREDFVSYDFESPTQSLEGMPDGLTISLPGGEFPSFQNLIIPDVKRVVGASASNIEEGLLTAESSVTWDADLDQGENTETTIIIEGNGENPTTSIDTKVEVVCRVNDDGEFEFPDEVKALIAQYNFKSEEAVLSRNAYSSEVQGDAAVVVNRSSAFVL